MRDRSLSTFWANMSYCGQHTLVKTNIATLERNAKRLWCNAWSCPDCAPRRRSRLIAEANGGQPRTFLTLTMPADETADPVDQAKKLNRAWRSLRQAICRKYKIKRLPHMTVMEATKKGTPHLHVLCRAPFIPQQWISDKMRKLAGAPIVDIRRIDKHRAIATYVAKYVGKDPHQFGTCKRYYKSRDYELRKDHLQKKKHRADWTFSVETRPLWSVIAYWQSKGWWVNEVTKDKAVVIPPWRSPFKAQAPPGQP